MYYVGYGQFKEQKAKALRDWFMKEENVQKAKEALPEGVKFIGLYFTVVGGEADYEYWFEIENYAALDAMSSSEQWQKALAEMVGEVGIWYKWDKTKLLKSVEEVRL